LKITFNTIFAFAEIKNQYNNGIKNSTSFR
jgi:hypothetical protein